MAGFTPINTPSSGAVASLQSQREGDRGTSDRKSNRTVASDYLGRVDDLPAAPPSKKTNDKGKKRATTSGDAPKAKRRRSSNIDRSLHVTKAHSNDQQYNGPDDADKPQRPSKPSKKANASKQAKNSTAAVSAANVDEGLTTKPVSVYASATSMDALDSTSARTSCDSVKANAGQSFTLYQGPSSDPSFHSNIEFSQPWLKSASDRAHVDSRTNIAGPQNGEFEILQLSDDSESPLGDDAISNEDVTKLNRPLDGSRRSARPKKVVKYAVEQIFPNLDETDGVQRDVQSRKTNSQSRRRTSATFGVEDDLSELPEDEVVELTKEVEQAIEDHRPVTPPPRGRKQNMREVDEHEDYGGALLSDAERKLLTKMKNASEGKIKPIVRKPFQSAILDRSPIFGASKSTVLRTSFRVGEALNFGAQAVRCNENAVIELYARVTFSKREGRKQHFVFKDLYHDKPPYLEGTFELWDQARLWDLDSTPFLKAKGPGILSRAIARMRRDGQKWRLDILSIWEASWEDVICVAGIYTGEVYEEDEYDI